MLRKALPTDSEFIFQVKKAAFKIYVDQVYGWDEETQRRLHERRFDTEHFWIVESDGIDAGYMSVAGTPEEVDLHQIFILPEHQSKGIGRACLLNVMERAKVVRLRVMKVNVRALSFYERLGFRQVGDTETHWSMEWQRPSPI